MRALFSVLIVSICTTTSWVGSTWAGTGLSLKAGLGYEFMSQEFFLDSLESVGLDSVEIGAALKTTYLDDVKGRLSLDYIPHEDYRLELRGAYEQAPDQFRLRLSSNYRPKLGTVSLDWSSELERRDGSTASADGDQGYLSGNGRAKLTVPVSSVVSLRGQLRSDFVQFDSAGEYAFNYWRFGGQVGVLHYFSNFSSLSVDLFSMNRQVDQFSHQDYRSSGLEGSFFGFYSGGEIDAAIRYETRDYNRSPAVGDYRRSELAARNKHCLGGSFFAMEELRIEAVRYDSVAFPDVDYERAELTFLAGISRGGWSLAAGPDLELLTEQQLEDFLIGQEYVEIGLKTQFDLVRPGLLFGSLESTVGRRDLKDEAATEYLHSDFFYERLNLLADWSIAGRLSLSILLSADWEWHDNSEENSRLFLLSSGLYYTF